MSDEFSKTFHIWFPAQIEHIGDIRLRQLIETHGGWPVMDTSWTGQGWSVVGFLGNWPARQKNTPLVSTRVVIDPKNSSSYVIKVNYVGQ